LSTLPPLTYAGATMGRLQHIASGRIFHLRSQNLIGRGARCDLDLQRREVSSEHATLRWSGSQWELRDLGSRNGSFLGERRLGPGERAVLAEGDLVAFGQIGDGWRLTDGGAPRSGAFPARGEPRLVEGELLALPDDEQPLLMLYAGPHGQWLVEQDGQTVPVQDGQVVEVAGQSWTLSLATHVVETVELSSHILTLMELKLRFVVSEDEENVQTSIVSRRGELSLGSRSFHYTLLTLARIRLRDQATPGLTESMHGWVYQDDLLRMVGGDANKLGVELFRARRQFIEAGVEGGQNIIERRAQSRQLRIGVAELEVISVLAPSGRAPG
jgi:FHA domain